MLQCSFHLCVVESRSNECVQYDRYCCLLHQEEIIQFNSIARVLVHHQLSAQHVHHINIIIQQRIDHTITIYIISSNNTNSREINMCIQKDHRQIMVKTIPTNTKKTDAFSKYSNDITRLRTLSHLTILLTIMRVSTYKPLQPSITAQPFV